MASISLSASAIFAPFNRLSGGVKQWGKLMPVKSWNPLISTGGWRRSFGAVVSSSEDGVNGGVKEVAEGEEALPRSYTWSDKKKPRVCILGGRFGGLYTALRLESLEWPDDKKPEVAFQQADFAGWNLWAAINDRPLLPFRFQNLGEMMTLGRDDAATSPSFIEGLTLEGQLGHAARKIAYLIRLPTDEHRLKVGISWFTKSAIDTASLLQSTLSLARRVAFGLIAAKAVEPTPFKTELYLPTHHKRTIAR